MIIYDERTKMPDGIELSSDIYLPEGKGKSTVILFRTPYGKNSDELLNTARQFSKRGFVFIANDVRGRGESDGKFIPYFSEAEDGSRLIEIFAGKPWSNGNVITWGASYSGRIQWLTALKKPEHLRGMISIVPPSDPFVENPSVSTSPMNLSWLFSLRGRGMQNINSVDWEEVYGSLPLINMPEKIGVDIPFWKQYFINRPESDFWKPLFYQGKMNNINLPVMHISGWYDDEQIGTFINYENMRKYSESDFSRKNQSLIVGPWGHSVNKDIKNDHIDFGNNSKLDLVEIESQWINTILEHRYVDNDERVMVFAMGPNRWIKSSDWPLKGCKNIHMYLSSEKSAAGISGDGRLIFDKPSYGLRTDQFTYDPMDPVPYLSGEGFAQIGGPDDYSEIEKRKDILVYTSGKMEEGLTIAGKITGRIFISSDCEDTDFTMKILDVHQDGYAQRLQDGITRLRYRNGPFQEASYEPGKIIQIEIDMWGMFHEIKKDHRLRIEISSSAFPKYARNQNIAGNQYDTTNYKVAKQKVYHGQQYSSGIEMQTVYNL